MKNLKIVCIFAAAASVAAIVLVGCKTVDLEKVNDAESTSLSNLNDDAPLYEEVTEENGYVLEKDIKVETEIVYLERPVFVPEEKTSPSDKKNLSGAAAVKDSLGRATVKPEHYKDGTFYYQYNENLVYEIYTQPFHLTDIILEEGEIVQEPTLLSEDETVWELTANVATNPQNGNNIQHLFLKPAYSRLDSTMIVITNRRVYHFRIKSFSDTHMAMVRFTYPNTRSVWAKTANSADENSVVVNEFVTVTNPEFLSFDYKMRHGLVRPEFLPKQVYDDGRKTYIVVDDIVLNKKLPLVFNENNELINYSVHRNTFVIPRLIDKVTLRLGKRKVVITKKKSAKKAS